jgi:hypothetical protein
MTATFSRIYTFDVLKEADYKSDDIAGEGLLPNAISNRWSDFLRHDFPKIDEIFSREMNLGEELVAEDTL